MIYNLIHALLYPDFGNFAILLVDSLKNGEMTLGMFSDLIGELHRLELRGYYEIPNDGVDDYDRSYGYWETSDLYAEGLRFAFLCLRSMVKDGKAAKWNDVVKIEDDTLNLRELGKRLESTAETLGDEDKLTEEWVEKINAIIFWSPESEWDFRLDVLQIINQSNADLVFGFCTRYDDSFSFEKLKEYQRMDPEDCFDIREIQAYHSRILDSEVGFVFIDRANENEYRVLRRSEGKGKKAQSERELLLALAEEEVYYHSTFSFPFTTYRLLTDDALEIHLRKKTIEQEILSEDQEIPDELRNVFDSAKDGDAASQSELASRYLTGTGLPKDDYRALFWMKLAADGGNALAQTNYGVALQNGLGGLDTNYKEAIEWFLKAADQGEHVAQYNLGLAYAKGLGVERDLKEMNKWMKLSADGGYFLAQLILKNGLIIRD